jgi:hypothetical protein
VPIFDEILILILILAHVDRVLTTASFKVEDHRCWVFMERVPGVIASKSIAYYCLMMLQICIAKKTVTDKPRHFFPGFDILKPAGGDKRNKRRNTL